MSDPKFAPSELPRRNSCHACGGIVTDDALGGICQRCHFASQEQGIWDPSEPASAEEVSEKLERYQVGETLGRGAVGAVYGAIDTWLNREVAIKVMADNPNNPEYRERFLREATAMAALNHPHVVTIYDFGAVEDLHFIVMERMDGGTLAEEMGESRKLPVPRALSVFDQICDGLAYAHSRGVVHRDIKPSNILIGSDGKVKLSDFGLVKGLLPEEYREIALTRTRMAIGTPEYMAPEQMRGSAKIDHRADVYSAGAVLYEMLTGESAGGRYQAASKFEGVPRYLDPVLDRGLHKEPGGRYDDISAFRSDVASPPKSRRSRRWLAHVATAGIGVLLAAGWKVYVPEKDGEHADPWAPTEAEKSGLPLRPFADEIDLQKDWIKVASFEFEDGDPENESFVLKGGATIEGGMLNLDWINHEAYTDIARTTPGDPTGVGINIRFRADSYLGSRKRDVILFDLSLHWTRGIFLESSKWGDPRPNVLIVWRQPLAPPEVIQPKFTEGEWHDVWITLTDGYRVWIDGAAVHRAASEEIAEWSTWGEEEAKMLLGGFKGKVDYVRIWEKR